MIWDEYHDYASFKIKVSHAHMLIKKYFQNTNTKFVFLITVNDFFCL